MSHKTRWLISLLLVGVLLVACAAPTTSTTQPATVAPTAEMANPASQNCVDQGGQVVMEKRGDEGEYGVCLFEDNMQCEEWAMMRGDCPVGGIKVTGYITPAAQYCAITGGTYTITGNNGADDEQGTCTFKDGSVCDVWDYYNGVCSPGQVIPTPEPSVTMQSYQSGEAGFFIQFPTTWTRKTLADQNDGNIHGESFSGPEGGVEIYWGVGFGGACPGGTEPVQLADGEVPACHTTNSDGTETWEQIDYQVEGGNSFSNRAYTSNAEPTSHDLVLQVLATLWFKLPAEVLIQPLTMEVCDGQAQAMSHTLDDRIPTQSEAPIDDSDNNAYGMGCQSMITGTGVDFENPFAVVDELGAMLESEGWTADPRLVGDSPEGTVKGYRKDNQICWAGAMWTPDASANCPKDQPISACEVTPEQQLYTVTLNCGEEIPAGGAAEPALGSPEFGGGSGQIVFDSDRGGNQIRDLYIMNSDGYDVSQLTQGDSNSFAGPWSPDGQQIVYTSYAGAATETYIALLNFDDNSTTILSNPSGSDEGFPDWSPDGTLIAFNSRRDGNNEIYLMNADGSNQVRLTDNPADDFAPSWSPDGTKIVFVSDRDQSAGITDLYIMNADGSGVTRLTNDAYLDYAPDWSPDGQKIAFRSDRDGNSDIYVINIDGSGEIQLTQEPAYDWSPQWSPDGKYIAFQTDRDGNFEIYRMVADGSELVNLTNDPNEDQMPFWRP